MEFRDDFRLVWLGGVPYVLPYGQASADLQRGMRLNAGSVLLWEALEEGATEEELLERMIAAYEPGQEDIPLLQRDLRQFLEQLGRCGILCGERAQKDLFVPFRGRTIKLLCIGGIAFALIDQGAEALSMWEFEPFVIEEYPMDQQGREQVSERADFVVTISNRMPRRLPVGRILVRNSELLIAENENSFLCIYPGAVGLVEWHLSKENPEAVIYGRGAYPDSMARDVFHAIRMIYLVWAQKKGMFALHSASLLYRGKAFLFSGHSGAGKSTHTALWQKLFGTPLLNGDLNLLAREEDGPVVHGMPWCGKSGISVTETYPLGGIVFVKQYHTEQLTELSDSYRALLVLQHLISPAWTKEMFENNLEFAKRLAAEIPVWKLLCTKEDSAAVAMKKEIDRFWEAS